METKLCKSCRETKNIDEFHKNKKQGAQHSCKECNKAQFKEYYQKNKQKYIDSAKRNGNRFITAIHLIKEARGCCCCGEKSGFCLDFHHIKGKKEFTLSEIRVSKSESLILKELAKCVVVCANCHRKIHSGVLKLEQTETCIVSLDEWRTLVPKQIRAKYSNKKKATCNKCGKNCTHGHIRCKECYTEDRTVFPGKEQFLIDKQNLTNKQIAKKYNVALSTVGNWINSISTGYWT